MTMSQIIIQNLDFTYEGDHTPVFQGLSLQLDTGWISDVESGAKAAITAFDWLGLVLICFLLPAVLTVLFAMPLRKHGWIKENDLKLEL